MNEVTTPTNYHDFRKRFLEAAQMRGLQTHSPQVRGLSPQGRPLFTDIVHNVLNPHLPTVIHISGCHGIEGYIGSAIQSAILEGEDFPMSAMSRLNLVFIHALNPYGMAWYRRVNGRNVDLNRNYFKASEERPMNSDFDLFSELFDKRSHLTPWKFWFQSLRLILKIGQRRSAAIIAGGQYHAPESIFFGGTENEPEITEPLRYLQKHLLQTPAIYVIDVHSGLGKFGSENLLLEKTASAEDVNFWLSAIRRPAITIGQSEFYTAHGILSHAFSDYFPQTKLHYLYEEFGTLSQLRVFFRMVKEHKTFLKLIMDRQRSFNMIATFYPYQKKWRPKCTETGKQTYLKLIDYLCQNQK